MFFLKSYRSGILKFCGSEINGKHNLNGPDSKECFKLYEDGRYSKFEVWKGIECSQPNVFEAVIRGKKSWGLWVKEWTDGINEWLFTREEILSEFEKRGIVIPEPLLKDFDNVLEKKRLKRIEKEIDRLKSMGFFQEEQKKLPPEDFHSKIGDFFC